jgi:hypothetical protein
MAHAELVLELGLEGGGLSVYRTPAGSGGSQFHVVGSTIDLDDNDDEAWRSWGTEPFPSLSEALRSVAQDGSWVLFFPIMIRPEFRTSVWQLAQDVAENLDDRQKKHWSHRVESWRQECRNEI